jgi:putative FmdB family regulatory protein
MPNYDTECKSCSHEWEQYHSIKSGHLPCPQCGSNQVETVITASIRINPPADMRWEFENNGLGRYCPQLETDTRKKSASAYCRSRYDLIEKAKKMGAEIFR